MRLTTGALLLCQGLEKAQAHGERALRTVGLTAPVSAPDRIASVLVDRRR